MCVVAGPLSPVTVYRPQNPRWQPSVCGPDIGHPSLGGSPWGLKLGAIRPGDASGQNLWVGLTSPWGELDIPRPPGSSQGAPVSAGGSAVVLPALRRVHRELRRSRG